METTRFTAGCDYLPPKKVAELREERAKAKKNRFFAIKEVADLQRVAREFLREKREQGPSGHQPAVIKAKAQMALWESLIQLLKKCKTCDEVTELLKVSKGTEPMKTEEVWKTNHELKKFI